MNCSRRNQQAEGRRGTFAGKPQEPEGGWKAWHEAKKAQFDATNPMAGGATKEDLWDLAKGKAFKKPKGGWFSKIKQQMKVSENALSSSRVESCPQPRRH